MNISNTSISTIPDDLIVRDTLYMVHTNITEIQHNLHVLHVVGNIYKDF